MIELVVLLALSALIGAQEVPCAACVGEACQVMDNVRVNKLCASELCVNGDAVVVGDGDPCTSDDVVGGVRVSVPIKDCCATPADCEQWMPDSCYTSVCMKIPDGGSHGVCVHTPIANCCASKEDCTPGPCEVAECRQTEGANQVTFTKLAPSDEHFTRLDKRQQTLSSPGQCVLTPTEEEGCCTKSEDCAAQAEPGKECFCDAGNKCVCLASTQFECLKDIDCQAPSMELDKCRAKGRCFDQLCDRGFCACKPDFDKDSDGDGVCCRDDCDDLDELIQESIFCTVLNGTVINKDNDTFVQCGAAVEEICATECPPGRVEVNETQLDSSSAHGKKNELFVRWDCDCCDANQNNTRPDEFLVCAKDADGDQVWDPVNVTDLAGLPPGAIITEIDLLPLGCYDKVCVLQPANNKHNKSPKKGGKGWDVVVTDELRSAQCAEFFNNNTEFVFVPEELRVEDAQCDQCPANAELQTADDQCPKTVEFAGATVAACSGDAEGTTLAACCGELLAIPTETSGLAPEVAKWRACCASLGGVFPAVPTGNECENVTAATFPLELEQCGCNPTEPPCEHPITCVPDKDHDWYYDCEAPETFCADAEWWKLVKNLEPAEAEDKLCRKMFKDQGNFGGLKKALRGQPNDPANFGKETFCDCNDGDAHTFEQIICFKDEDGDGFPAEKPKTQCDDAGEVKCEAKCAKKCPKGYLGIDHKIGSADGPNCRVEQDGGGGKGRKRYSEQLREAVAKSCGSKCKDNDHHDDEQTWYVDDEDDESEHSKTSRSTSKDSEHSNSETRTDKPHRPRVDQTCENVECDELDCCDKDKWTHPSAPGVSDYNSADLNACGNLDYSCDCKEDPVIVCGATPISDVAGTQIFVTRLRVDNDDLADQMFIPGVGPTPGGSDLVVGKCSVNPADDCFHQAGWSLESAGGLHKRALSVPLMSACTSLVKVKLVGGEVKVYNATTPLITRDFETGDCAEWVEGCTKFDGMCSPDCEICLQSFF